MIIVYPFGTPLLYTFVLWKHWPELSKLRRKEMRGKYHEGLGDLAHGSTRNLTLEDIEEERSERTKVSNRHRTVTQPLYIAHPVTTVWHTA